MSQKVLIPKNVKKGNHKYVFHENSKQMFFTTHHTSSESNSSHHNFASTLFTMAKNTTPTNKRPKQSSPAAADDDPGAVGDRVPNVLVGLLDRALVDQRPDRHALLRAWIAHHRPSLDRRRGSSGIKIAPKNLQMLILELDHGHIYFMTARVHFCGQSSPTA